MSRVTHAIALLIVFGLAGQVAAQERLLVGLFVNGEEFGAVEAFRSNGTFHVPLESFAAHSRSSLEVTAAGSTLTTPLGRVALEADDVTLRDGIAFIGADVLSSKLHVVTEFNLADYALYLKVPWSLRENELTDGGIPIVPDVTPSSITLSMYREDLIWNRSAGLGTFSNYTTLGGALDKGFWRVRAQNALKGQLHLHDYGWYRSFEQSAFFFGQQRMGLHPLMRSLDLTGAQMAWTNIPLGSFQRSFNWGELLPRSIQPTAALTGSAEPGSIVELRIDGYPRGRQVVGFDGRYEFDDVELPTRQLADTEIIIRDPVSPVGPTEIRQVRIHTSEFQLPAGAVVHMGGFGSYGNLANSIFAGDTRRGFAGFYRWRRGLTDWLTTEAAVQSIDGDAQGTMGVVSRFAGIVSSTSVGTAHGRAGYTVDAEGRWPQWRLLARSSMQPDGYFGEGFTRNTHHSGELWFSQGLRFELGAVARSQSAAGIERNYALPAAVVRPLRSTSITARPNFEGRYRVTLASQLTPRDRFRVTHEYATSFEATHRFARPYRLTLTGDFIESGPGRFVATIGNFRRGRFNPTWNAGITIEHGRPGAILNGSMELLPGIVGRLNYRSRPSAFLDQSTSSISFQLSADFTLAGSRLMPANTASMQVDRGAIAGRVIIESGDQDGLSLGDLIIEIDGRPASRTNSTGYFFVGNLESGIYTVELGVDNLPIELSPVTRSIVAEVIGGATTRADFVVRLEYGVAGRVLDPLGRPWPGIDVEFLDSEGRRMAGARTDQFGLYRVDGLPVGRYHARVAADSLPLSNPRPVFRVIDVVDRFLFGQDLVFPDIVAPDERRPGVPRRPGTAID